MSGHSWSAEALHLTEYISYLPHDMTTNAESFYSHGHGTSRGSRLLCVITPGDSEIRRHNYKLENGVENGHC